MFSEWLCDFRQPLILSGPQFSCPQRREHVSKALHLKLAEEFMAQSRTLCRMLVFSGAALPSLHFHEKDPGSAQFLWSQLCKQMPGSTLIGASVSLLPPPGIYQDSVAPHSSLSRLDTLQNGQQLYSTPVSLYWASAMCQALRQPLDGAPSYLSNGGTTALNNSQLQVLRKG